jgi:hypothetical protein
MTAFLRYSRSRGLVPQGIHGVKWLVVVTFKASGCNDNYGYYAYQ